MRHHVSGYQLNRSTDQRKALRRTLIKQLFEHNRIQTTQAKAKAIRGDAEKLITLAKNSAKGTDIDKVNARRLAASSLDDAAIVKKLFDDVAPRFENRNGGYTRMIKLGQRAGDSADMVVLELVEEEVNSRFEFESLPAEYAWIGLGSEGRNEETFVTDQDNMIIYGSGNGQYKTDVIEEYYESFSKKAVDRLAEAGFKKCKAGIMPSGEKWRGSDQAWKNRLEDRIVFRKGIFKDPDIIIFSDARLIKGSRVLFDEVMMFFFNLLSNSKHIMKDFIRLAVFMPTAIAFFGKFRVEKRGYYKDRFNIKLMGWIPLVMSVRTLAISNGIYNETKTLKRIRMLKEKNLIDNDMEKNLIDAYLTFMNFRLMNQIKRFGCKKNGVADIDYVRPDMSGQASLEEMRMSMKSVEAFQKHIEELMLLGQPT